MVILGYYFLWKNPDIYTVYSENNNSYFIIFSCNIDSMAEDFLPISFFDQRGRDL